MVTVQSVSKTEDLSVINSVLQDDGCVVVENVLDGSELSLLRRDLDKAFAKVPNCRGDFYGYETKRLSSLFTKAAVTQRMALDPIALGVMDEFLLRGCQQYQINLTQGISIGKGEPPQVIHQDDGMFQFNHPDFEVMINCMWAVDDFTAENGATNLVPGSHKWERSVAINPENMRRPEQHEITPGVMNAGSVLIYLGSLYHGGGQNITNDPRRGVVVSYCQGWARQAENQYLAYTPEETREMPEALQRLMGYFVHAPNLGSVKGQDPFDVLHGRETEHFEEFIPDNLKPLLREYRAGFEDGPSV